jgi:hypothetical protein
LSAAPELLAASNSSGSVNNDISHGDVVVCFQTSGMDIDIVDKKSERKVADMKRQQVENARFSIYFGVLRSLEVVFVPKYLRNLILFFLFFSCGGSHLLGLDDSNSTTV